MGFTINRDAPFRINMNWSASSNSTSVCTRILFLTTSYFSLFLWLLWYFINLSCLRCRLAASSWSASLLSCYINCKLFLAFNSRLWLFFLFFHLHIFTLGGIFIFFFDLFYIFFFFRFLLFRLWLWLWFSLLFSWFGFLRFCFGLFLNWLFNFFNNFLFLLIDFVLNNFNWLNFWRWFFNDRRFLLFGLDCLVCHFYFGGLHLLGVGFVSGGEACLF